MLVNEISCKSILSKSRLYGCDFSINPYRGCEHACIYCYAPYILREQREWGSFVDVKVNSPEILVKDLLKAKRGVIYISSVTDPYQPLEKKYELTRKILEILKDTKFFVSIQTKSSLVLRDIDLLREMDCEVGFTITSLDENARRVFEPNASPIEERLRALKELKEVGISTYIFFGPFLPFISDRKLINTINNFSKVRPDYIWVDKLNIKSSSHWKKIRKIIQLNYPRLVERWERILFSENNYYIKIKRRVSKYCKKAGVRCKFCY